MNVSEWKEKAQERLRRFAVETERWSAGLLYGGLTASAVFPLMETASGAMTAGNWQLFASVISLAGTLLGGNLLAGEITRWRDRSEAEIAGELENKAQSDPHWRDALDRLLLELDAPRIVQAVLPERDWDRFQRMLQGELAKLGNQEKYVTYFINTDGGAYVGRDVTITDGDFVTGPKTVINKLIQIYIQAAPQATEVDYQTALIRYLNHLLTTRHLLNLRGIRSFQPVSIQLEHAYITLRGLDPKRTEQLLSRHQGKTRTRALEEMLEKEQERPQPLQHLLRENARLVVLGDPGSGKTTFLSFLALSAARAVAQDNPALLTERLGFDGSVPLPVYVPLREFGRYLRDRAGRERLGPRPQLLLDYLTAYFEGWNLALPADFFVHHLEAGNCLLLLDGLDEVADFDERVLVSDQVEAFVQRYGTRPARFSETWQVFNRFVITCRVRGYTGQARLGLDFTTATVLPFSQDEIESFVQNWCLAVAAAQAQTAEGSVQRVAQENAADLLRAINSSPKVRELAGNPLLLTVIALVHQYRAKLPERRAELYDECTEVLLGYFEAAKPGDESKWLARYTGTAFEMDAGEKRAFLEPIALAMHQTRNAEWEKSQLIDFFAHQFAERGQTAEQARRSAADFLEALAVRSGLIQEIEQGSYAFLHLSFQEYLAARKMADGPMYIAESLTHLDDSWWREVLLLEAGHLSEGGRGRMSRLVEAILDATGDPQARLLLAAACLADVGQHKTEAALWQRVVDGLLAAMTGDLPPKARAEAGKALAALGDPRQGVGVVTRQGISLPDIDWVKIPEADASGRGEFIYQKNERRVEPDFWMARYPITYAQFQTFVDAPDGWRNPEWWHGLALNDQDSPYQQFFPVANHPRENVSWYQAMAFCRWLTAQSRRYPDLLPEEARGKDGWRVSLPTEWQWEKAARGHDGREYPWGKGYLSGYANVDERAEKAGPYYLASTSAVGIYPQGKSPYGILDMSGNAWEWCLNEHENPDNWQDTGDEDRVLRGGGWSGSHYYAAAAVRVRRHPSPRWGYFGFRVVVSRSAFVPVTSAL